MHVCLECQGRCTLQKPLLRQARALYVLELKALEDAVLEERQPHLVVIAGDFLFCAMAVCRFVDSVINCIELYWPEGVKIARNIPGRGRHTNA